MRAGYYGWGNRLAFGVGRGNRRVALLLAMTGLGIVVARKDLGVCNGRLWRGLRGQGRSHKCWVLDLLWLRAV